MLFKLLQERNPIANISHQCMHTFGEHCAFVRSKPYYAWYLILVNKMCIGATYLTRVNEIGISLRLEHQGKGFGPRAVRMLMRKHKRERYLANVAPNNSLSAHMFDNLGFHLLQMTYVYEPN
jgi:RimJ/RimL family protein N-acetyltransferase